MPADRDAAAIVARLRVAAREDTAVRVRTLRLDLQVDDAGVRGVGVRTEDLHDGRFSYTEALGPASSSYGFDGDGAWSADASGASLPEQGALGEAIAGEAIRTAWVYGRSAEPVAVVDERTFAGHRDVVLRVRPRPPASPFDAWVDRRTHLIDRIDTRIGTTVASTVFSDYRTVAGVVVPFARTSSDGMGNRSVETVVRVSADALPPARIARPPMPHDTALPHGATTVPIAVVANHVYVDAVYVNGRGPFRFIVDTGGSDIVTPQLAHRLGLRVVGSAQSGGSGAATVTEGFAHVDRIRVGGATMRHQPVQVFAIDASVRRGDGVQIDGMLGYQLFARFRTRIAYAARRMTLSLPAANGEGTEVPLRFDVTHPDVDAVLDGRRGRFLIDTGSRGFVDLTTPFVRRHDLVARYRARVAGINGFGVGGSSRAWFVRGSALVLGAATVRDLPLTLGTDRRGFFADPDLAGNIGGGVLRRFAVTFDYAHRRMRLVREPQNPPAFDRSGLVIADVGGRYQIVDVRTHTPAAGAMIPTGSTVVSVDGHSVRGRSLEAVRASLAAPAGTHVALVVSIGGALRRYALTLQTYP